MTVSRETLEMAAKAAGYEVRFDPGMKTTDPDRISLGAIEMVSRAENMSRNSVHRLPKALAEVVQLRGVLTRQINKSKP